MLLADGCGVSRISQSSCGDLGDAGAEGGDIGGMIGEAIVVAADRRQAVGIDDLAANPAIAAAPVQLSAPGVWPGVAIAVSSEVAEADHPRRP